MAKPTRNQGELSGGPGPGGRTRKLDTWTFYGSSVKNSRDEALVFEVTMASGFLFQVDTAHIPPERFQPLKGTDLSALYEQASDIAAAEYDLRHNLTWTDWLEIQVKTLSKSEGRDFTGAAKAFVSYRVIPRAEKPDGAAYTTVGHNRKSLVPFPVALGVAPADQTGWGVRTMSPEQKAQIEASTRPDSAERLSAMLGATEQRDSDTQFSYLPDTPANRAALDAVIAVIDQANRRLQEFLSPDRIQETLERALVSSGHLLSGPSAPEPEVPSPRRRAPGA